MKRFDIFDYGVIVLITLLQTVLLMWQLGADVFTFAPFTVRIWANYTFFTLLLWSPLLLTRHYRWTYVVSLLLDIWFVGNLLYFRSYGDCLSRWCLENVSNMNGLWDAVVPFFRRWDLGFLLGTGLWILFCEYRHRHMPVFPKGIAVAVCLWGLLAVPQVIFDYKESLPMNPFNRHYADLSMGRFWYVQTYGPLAHFGNEFVNWAGRSESPVEPVSEEEIRPFMQEVRASSDAKQGNLLFIFFESWEYWTVGLRVEGEEVTPHINRLITHPQAACYPMKAQVREGKSSDAQLIALTGLLPIRNGAVSMRYAGNVFPSWVKAAEVAVKQIFTPCAPYMWNQSMLALSFGFDSLFAQEVSDVRLAREVKHSMTTSDQPWIIMMTTMASHSPFTAYADSAALGKANGYSPDQQRYLQCVHYTDRAIGEILETVFADSLLAATTRIVITGDHPIFELDTPVPFVLYDPFCPPAEARHDLNQADIYTTLIDRMGVSTTWRGMGQQMTDTAAVVSENECFALSDRIIRTDYFRSNP